MRIGVVGLNHETASADIRERVSFSESKKIEAISSLLDKGIKEVVILSTCSRSEIYYVDYANKIEDSGKTIIEFLMGFFDVNGYEEFFYSMYDKWAIDHIYRVTAGLDSIVLGEDQILGQVKSAQEFSLENGGCKKILNKLFREAVTTAKKIKTTLKVSEHPLSLSYIGVQYIKEILGTVEGKKVAVIGYGKMGRLALKNIIEDNPEELYVINRSYNRVEDILEEYPKIKYGKFEDKYNILKDMDIVISSTAASHTVIKSEDFVCEKDCVMLDLSMPRDIDHSIGNRDNITLINIDDLKTTSEENQRKRQALASKAKEIIDIDVNDFVKWLKSSKSDDVIKNMNLKIDEIKEDTMKFFNKKLDMNCSEKAIIEKMLVSSLKRMIREPILSLKDEANNEKLDIYIDTLNKLYGFKENK